MLQKEYLNKQQQGTSNKNQHLKKISYKYFLLFTYSKVQFNYTVGAGLKPSTGFIQQGCCSQSGFNFWVNIRVLFMCSLYMFLSSFTLGGAVGWQILGPALPDATDLWTTSSDHKSLLMLNHTLHQQSLWSIVNILLTFYDGEHFHFHPCLLYAESTDFLMDWWI